MLSRLAPLALAAAACSDERAIHLCGRGDAVAFEGGVQISFLDGAGRVIAFGNVDPTPSDYLDVDAPEAAVEVLVEGKDASGATVAHGRAELAGDGACACVAQEAQYFAACEGIACRVHDGACRFVDRETEAAPVPRTIIVGENSDDTVAGASDTFVRGGAYVDGNFGRAAYLDISADEIPLLRFDLSALPTTSQVTAASLTIYATANGSSESASFARILESWDEGTLGDGSVGAASWSHRRPGELWTDAGCGVPGSREAAPLASRAFPASSATTVETPLLQTAVQQWVQEPTTNFGVALIGTGDSSLVASEGADGQRPRLSVTYSLP